MTKVAWRANEHDVTNVVTGRHTDPFAILGVHQCGLQWVARCFIPGAEAVEAFSMAGQSLGRLALRHEEGFFEGLVTVTRQGLIRYAVSNAGGQWSVLDPYACGPVLGPMDDYYSAEGSHLRLYDKLGAHILQHEGVSGTHFSVWAPNASRVSVIGDFNAWDGRRHAMRKRQDSGVWEIFLPGVDEGALYKFEILDGAGHLLPLKSDPFGFAAELRPNTASRVRNIHTFTWSDEAYLAQRAQRDARRSPMSIYEVHAGSWQRHADGRFLSYDELAERLVPYVCELGFTHIEFLPVTEHPFDPSWGYQPTGLYAPTSRFGDAAGFARFVNTAHLHGIGVILDWVPAHFPTDAHGLSRFDGTALYEHQDPRLGYHPDWNTAIYNFGRREVANYLINNALFWLEHYHLDGLRVDAVASMLYLDYSRKEGEWLPNIHGGRENLEAIDFLRRMNKVAYGKQAGIVTIAEESTAWPGVSKPVHEGGLGFGFKWNMGFMHDTLGYLARDPVHRKHHHNELTFGLLYAFTENFVLPLSHDEVVHGKGSLLNKMAGDDWQKFATLRAYYAFMWAYPGKKLLFMGQEMAPWTEWSEARSLDWHLLDHAPHSGMRALVTRLNALYQQTPALHARDCEGEGFEWLIVDDKENSVLAWQRNAGDGRGAVVVVVNFTPVPRDGYVIPLPQAGYWREVLNTNAQEYWGEGRGNLGGIHATEPGTHGKPASARICLPPLATLYFVREEG
ncbi:1,4-alpha-glucan branching protein GlgB [Uliginosibacterium gangwonense]|uniref:1,4-alpha-glucan branching protein GlgB n=1 Tax=Uliginosibacterium gangwonense TaxID=392736 RepID=UPI00035D0994|nr:1,4-alpha-glucan branching protein GlgB [Uliginosibacterium gangwonense]